MKIVSRPETAIAGEGEFTLRMTFEQLELIGSLMYITRLGSGSVYRDAAFELMSTLEQLFDSDFDESASDNVDLNISVLDDDGDTIIEQHHHSNVCIEV